jgi:CDP-glycerol glycerophosphotransferase
MPAISVVIPVYDVETYLEECLRSVEAQTVRDLEVIVVDDGSTDASAEIAHRFAERDRRIRIISQSNQGLGRARNVGLAAADCEVVSFVDSDDILLPHALELLHGSIQRTGSDFATGMVHRYDGTTTQPAKFLKKAFMRSRARTHVTRFPWLVADRVAWNKVWRRSFLEEHQLRFAEGMFHEDIPMVVPAHFLARSVDVLAKPVYLWRERSEGAQSITQRRLDMRLLLDRFAAVEQVCDFLEDGWPEAARHAYYESALADDLRYHLNVLDAADAEYQRVFLDRANAFLDRAGEDAEAGLHAFQRLKWHLVRRRLLDELLEVVVFEHEALRARPRTIRGGRLYGDYPFLDDPRLQIPRSVYRLDTGRRRLHQAVTFLRPATVPRRELRAARRPDAAVARS